MMRYIVKAVPFKKQETIELANNILLDKGNNLVEFLVQEFKGYPVLIVQGAQILNNVPGLDKEKYKHQIQKLIGKIPLDARLVKEYDDEDDEDDFDDGIWIEFPFRETT